MWWVICIVIFIVTWCIIGYGLYTAEVMPDDFELKEEDVWPGTDERSDFIEKEEDANKEN